MDGAGKKGGADWPVKIMYGPANEVEGEFEPLRRGSETPATYDFQKNPGRVPIRETADGDAMVFLLRNTPFQHQTHTWPLLLAKLARTSSGPQPLRVSAPEQCAAYTYRPGPVPRGLQGAASVPPLKGKPREFSCKPSDICKFIERSDRRLCGYAAGIPGKAAPACDFRDRSRAGQLPKGSGPFAQHRSAGRLHPHAQ